MTRITAGVYYSTHKSPQTPLPVLASRLRTEIVDLTASHTLTQIFCNPRLQNPTKENYTTHIQEAKYTFPLYESCAVSAFSAQIGPKSIIGVVKPMGEAKAVYETAKAAGKQTALLEQNTGEVFTTSIGNILPGEFVFVVIKYVHELKQDIEAGGVRLVVPTIIAPKYGWTSFDNSSYTAGWGKGWNTMSQKIEEAAGGRPETPGLVIEVVVTMNGSIRGIQSPSHPISVNIGSHDPSGQGELNSKMARATLAISSTSTGLDKDFSLMVNSTDISLPRAFLAPHPTLPSTSTLLVTLAPRFELPQQHPEIVFIVDRSGSMHDKISTVRSALHLFLASLPVGTFFNIISFGNRHSSLWPTSQSYTAENLEAAKGHVSTMMANMGGTEMLDPCKAAVENRRADLKLEVLVLTDGEIWHSGPLFEYINNAASSGDARFFSLGVGRSVSHLLVEGISRAGKGYSQIVGEGESMQRKVMRMLKAALTPHVNDWSVDWDGKSAIMNSFKDPQKRAETPVVHAAISLFDPSCDPDNTTSAPPLLPTLPPILQAPTTIPPLYPFARTTLYFLLTDPCTPPTAVNLAGNAYDSNTNTIHPLKLTIPITPIKCPTTSLGLYSLLGRKLLQDLEEGRCGYLPPSSSLTDAEGTRLGVTFGLASKWTSFVAVATGGEDRASTDKTPLSDWEEVGGGEGMEGIGDYGPEDIGKPFYGTVNTCSGGSPNMYSPPPMRSFGLDPIHSFANFSTFQAVRAGAPKKKSPGVSGHSHRAGYLGNLAEPVAQPLAAPLYKTPCVMRNHDSLLYLRGGTSSFVPVSSPPPPPADTTPSGLITNLSHLQRFSGHFPLSAELLQTLGLSRFVVDGAKQRLGITAGDVKMETSLVTCMVLVWLRKQMKEHEEEWELIAEKAKGCVESDVGKEMLARMEKEAESLV